MYENIFIPLFIICIVTLMYCVREIMKYKNPSIVHKEYRKIIWEEMIMNKCDDIISRQLQMFELSKRIEAKNKNGWSQFLRDTVPFILWKISESDEGMSYPEVISALEEYESLNPLSVRYKFIVLVSLMECANYGVLEQPDDIDDDKSKWKWIGSEVDV